MNKRKVLMIAAVTLTMLISGLHLPKVNAAELNAKANFQLGTVLSGKYTMTVALSNKLQSLTVEDIKTLVESKLGENVFNKVTFNNKTLTNKDTVPTGSVIEITGGIKVTVIIYGDVNQDGKVNAVDASAVLKHAAKVNLIKDEAAKEAADVTYQGKDGVINAQDASQILKYVAKLLKNEAVVKPEAEAKEETSSSILSARSAKTEGNDIKSAMGENYDKYENNMQWINDIYNWGNTISIKADVDNMKSYKNAIQKEGKWIGILLDTGISREKLESGTYNIIDGKEKVGSATFGANENEILLWFDATPTGDTNKREYQNVTLKVNDQEEISFNLIIENVPKTTIVDGKTKREIVTKEALISSLDDSYYIDSIVLNEDLDLTETLKVDGFRKVLDLNGHTIKASKGIDNKAYLTITDSKNPIKSSNPINSIDTIDSQVLETGMIIQTTTEPAITNEANAELIIESGYYNAQENYTVVNNGYVYIYGGMFENSKKAILMNASSATIEGGTFKLDADDETIKGYIINERDDEYYGASLEIIDGLFIGKGIESNIPIIYPVKDKNDNITIHIKTSKDFEDAMKSSLVSKIVLEDNFDITKEIKNIYDKEIDLNGHTITTKKATDETETTGKIVNYSNSSLIIKDTKGTGGITAEDDYAIENTESSSIDIYGGTFKAQKNSKAALYNQANAHIYDGSTFICSDENSTCHAVVNNDYMRINGGTFKGGENAIMNDSNGHLYIYGGTFENNIKAVLLNRNYTEISGGTFIYGGKESIIFNDKNEPEYLDTSLIVYRGKFEASDSSAVFIKAANSENVKTKTYPESIELTIKGKNITDNDKKETVVSQ